MEAAVCRVPVLSLFIYLTSGRMLLPPVYACELLSLENELHVGQSVPVWVTPVPCVARNRHSPASLLFSLLFSFLLPNTDLNQFPLKVANTGDIYSLLALDSQVSLGKDYWM